jgi:hypothetical protein
MKDMGCQSIKLETEVTNKAALRLYEDRLGFIREEFLRMYYLNWGDAYRLRLWFDDDDDDDDDDDNGDHNKLFPPNSLFFNPNDDDNNDTFGMYG